MFFFLGGGGGNQHFVCKLRLVCSFTFFLPDPTSQDVDDEEDDDYIDELFCVACNKAFKSERAYVVISI